MSRETFLEQRIATLERLVDVYRSKSKLMFGTRVRELDTGREHLGSVVDPQSFQFPRDPENCYTVRFDDGELVTFKIGCVCQAGAHGHVDPVVDMPF